MTTYRIYTTLPCICTHIVSPYFFIRDEENFDRSAIFAGIIKENHETLTRLAHTIARLTSVTAPEEEVRAREALEAMIDAKRQYGIAEHYRMSKAIHERNKRIS